MEIPVRASGRRPPLAVWLAIATGVAAPLWVEAVAPARWPAALSFEPSFAGALFLSGAVVGTVMGVRCLWGVHCALAIAAVVFTGSAALAHADAQAIGGFVLAASSLVLLLFPPVGRYEAKRCRAPGKERRSGGGPHRVADGHTHQERAGPAWDPARSLPIDSRALRPLSRLRPVDQAGTREVGDLVGFCRSPGIRAGRWPRPARDGSAASHLGGLLPSMQVGPPPFSRTAHREARAARWQQRPPGKGRRSDRRRCLVTDGGSDRPLG